MWLWLATILPSREGRGRPSGPVAHFAAPFARFDVVSSRHGPFSHSTQRKLYTSFTLLHLVKQPKIICFPSSRGVFAQRLPNHARHMQLLESRSDQEAMW